MLVKLCLIAASLAMLGYLRSAIDGLKPEYLLDIKTMMKKWHSENNWVSRFSPFFSLFLFIFNLFAWIIYGFSSVIELIGFFVRKIWWLILWIWNEVLHPTIFAFVCLLWHYLAVFSWRFFSFSCSKITEAVQKDKIWFALKKLLILGGVSGLLGLCCLFFDHIIVWVLSALIVFYWFQYTVFATISYYRSDSFPTSKIFPGLKLSLLWLAMSAVSTAFLFALSQYANIYIIGGLSVMLIQVLLPFAALFGLAFIATTLYLPPYIGENGDNVDLLKFLKTVFFRFPKLLASQPYQFVGIAVLSIIPAIVLVLLNTGIKQITDKDLQNWGEQVMELDYHIPAVIENNQKIKVLDSEISVMTYNIDSLVNYYTLNIDASRNELAGILNLKTKIEDRKIHTFDRKAHVGENQSFSMPEIPACQDYELIISDASTNKLIKRLVVSTAGKSGSLLLFHQWNAPGKYNVTIKTKTTCSNGVEETIQVEVIKKPEQTVVHENNYFVTREAADYAVEIIKKQLDEYQQVKQIQLQLMEKEKNVLEDQEDYLRFNSSEHIQMLISKVLAYFGLVLLFVLYLSAIWTYWVTYHYDIFGFEQEGKHYHVRLLEEIREKNPNQPLLGIFILIVLVVIILCFTQFNDFIVPLF